MRAARMGSVPVSRLGERGVDQNRLVNILKAAKQEQVPEHIGADDKVDEDEEK